MIWYTLGFFAWLLLLFWKIKDVSHMSWKETWLSALCFLIIGWFLNALSGMVLSYVDKPASNQTLEVIADTTYDLIPFDDENFVRFTSETDQEFPKIYCLLDTGEIKSYNITGNRTLQFRVAVNGETPNVRVVEYGMYRGYQKWLALYPGVRTYTYITLPPGIAYPIT